MERTSRLSDRQNELIVEHFDFAKRAAFKCSVAKSLNASDVIDLAIEGLIKAAMRYDESKEVKFTSFAYRVIHNHLIDVFKRDFKEYVTDEIELEQPPSDQDSFELMMHENRERLHTWLIEHQHDREIKLLIHRYYADSNRLTTQSELTSFFELSQAQLSYLEKKAKDRLKQALA